MDKKGENIFSDADLKIFRNATFAGSLLFTGVTIATAGVPQVAVLAGGAATFCGLSSNHFNNEILRNNSQSK